MKRIILLIIFAHLLAAFSLNAQDCNFINDVKHSECHPVTKTDSCYTCNFPNHDSIPSWDENKIIELTTSGENHFIRFYHSENGYKNKKGRWITKRKDVCDEYGELLPPDSLKNILKITYIPEGYVIVIVPPGSKLLEGAIFGSTCETCRQFCIQGDLENVRYYQPALDRQ